MKKDQSKPQVSWVAFIAVFCAFAFLLSSLSISITTAFQREKIEANYFEGASKTLDQITEIIDTRFSQQRQQVHFLHATPPIQGILRASNEKLLDPLDSTTRDQWIDRLQTIFIAFLESNPLIVKARYVGVADDGKEVLRVERQQGDVIAADAGMLMQLNKEDYYDEVLALPPNAIYTSNIRLNKEFGRIEFPTWSTYQIAKAIYDQNGDVFGFIVLSFYADSLLDHLRDAIEDHQNIYLLNANGGFLIHPNKKYEFSFEIGDQAYWDLLYKGKGIYTTKYSEPIYESVEHEDKFYFAEREVLLDWPGSGRLVKPVIAIPARVIKEQLEEVQWLYTWITIVTILVVFFAVLYYRFRVSRELTRYVREAEFEAIFLGSRDAIISLDKKGRIKSWNPSAEGMFQYGANYAVGKSVFNLIFDTDDQVFGQKMLEDIVNGIQVKPMDTVAHDKNLTPIQVEVSLSAIIDEERGIQSIAAIVRNIAERKRFEEKIINLNETLEHRVEERTQELAKARDDAQQASRSKSSFIASVSHEIRTPMNGILGMISLMKRGEMSEKQRRLLNNAESSAQSLTVLINDLLDISKIESGKMQFEHRAYNVVSLVNDMAASLSVSAFEKEIDFIVDCSGVEHEWLLGDQARIRQVLYNLVGNAIKYTHSGHIEVVVSTHRTDSKAAEVLFKVEDTGVGIETTDLDQLFEAFSTVEKADGKNVNGTGLGLTISKQLCRKMGGDIYAKSEKDKGSTFFATIQSEISSQHLPTFNDNDLKDRKVLILRSADESWKVIERQLTAWGIQDLTVENVSDYARITSRSWFDFVIVNSCNNYAESFTAATYLLKSHVVQDKENVIILTPANASYEGGNVFTEITKPFNSFVLWAKLRGEEPPEINSEQFDEPLIDLGIRPDYSKELVDYSDGERDEDSASNKKQNSRFCVLIVDDTPINIDVAEGMLEDWGISTLRATNGKDAILRLKQAPHIDLVLMDCQMPEMDGLETTAKIRSGKAGAKHQFVPIVAITANAMAGTEECCLAAGMNDYLTKPVEQDLLKAVLAKYVQLPKPTLVKTEPLEVTAAPKAKLWEKTDLLRRLKGRDDRAIKLIEAYIATVNRLRRDLQMHMNKFQGQGVDDINTLVEELLNCLDGIVGSSTNIGAKQLQESSLVFQKHIKDGRFDTAYREFEALNDIADKTIDSMKVFVVDLKADRAGVGN